MRSNFLKIREAVRATTPSPVRSASRRTSRGGSVATWSTDDGELGRAPITEEDVLAIFAENADVGLTDTAVRKLVAQARGAANGKARKETVLRFLLALEKKGTISRCTIQPKTGKPFPGWRLGPEGGEVEGVSFATKRTGFDEL